MALCATQIPQRPSVPLTWTPSQITPKNNLQVNQVPVLLLLRLLLLAKTGIRICSHRLLLLIPPKTIQPRRPGMSRHQPIWCGAQRTSETARLRSAGELLVKEWIVARSLCSHRSTSTTCPCRVYEHARGGVLGWDTEITDVAECVQPAGISRCKKTLQMRVLWINWRFVRSRYRGGWGKRLLV